MFDDEATQAVAFFIGADEMTMLVTLQQASDYIRRDTEDDDALLTALVEAASDMVLNYLKDGIGLTDFLDSDGLIVENSDGEAENVPPAVKSATLYLTAYLYRHRDSDPDKGFERGYLPAPVTAMLYPYRDPALA